MNFTNLNIKLIEDNGYCDVLIRLDGTFENEFGEEFNVTMFGTDNFQTESLRKHIRAKFPGRKLRRARITLHGITLATMPITTKTEKLAQNTQYLGLVSAYRPSDEPEPEDTGLQLQDYEIKHGDTLWIIAAKFNTTTESLSEINNISGSLEAGRKISVPICLALSDYLY